MVMLTAQTSFELKKEAIVKKVQQLNKNNEAIYLQKATSNLFRHRRPRSQGIDVKSFNQVIDISMDKRVVNVEGMITYEQLVAQCLKHHCLPCVVPELKTITVGGALTGCGIESSSFKYGLMHETVLEIEVLLGDGRVLICTKTNEYQDLFRSFPNSYGTLGYALRVCLAIYPVKPYVHLKHQPFTDAKRYFAELQALCIAARKEQREDFIEGVCFEANDLYITQATMVDAVPWQSDYTYQKIYYQSLKMRKEDFLTIEDYIWRWDTDWFWCSKFFFLNSSFIRWLFGKKRLNSSTYQKIRRFCSTNSFAQWLYTCLYGARESIIQDVQIPIDNAIDFLHFFNEKIGVKPVWICPTMPYLTDMAYDLYPMDTHQLYVNFGFWDSKAFFQEEGYYNRLIEEKVMHLKGKKSLYSTVYYNEKTFWQLYNKKAYLVVKKKYDPQQRLQSLYEKCIEK